MDKSNVLTKSKILFSFVVATRNRKVSLCQLLESLDRISSSNFTYEIIIVDNGSIDGSVDLLLEWIKQSDAHKIIRMQQGGKSCAINAGVAAAQGELLAFLDDDVVVDPQYLVETYKYFQSNDCAAAQGSVHWPDHVKDDPSLITKLETYGTVPVYNNLSGNTVRKLLGANMVIRRSIFEKIGFFNEALGPGATGFSEDDELADRILATGRWIGWMPKVRVIHEVDKSRLTEEAFRQRNILQGRSRYVYKKPSNTRVFVNYLFALVRQPFLVFTRDRQQKYRAKGRYYHYKEMVRLVLHQNYN